MGKQVLFYLKDMQNLVGAYVPLLEFDQVGSDLVPLPGSRFCDSFVIGSCYISSIASSIRECRNHASKNSCNRR